jgi:hypothetical protein
MVLSRLLVVWLVACICVAQGVQRWTTSTTEYTLDKSNSWNSEDDVSEGLLCLRKEKSKPAYGAGGMLGGFSPVVIGGLGDSGTRSVRNALQFLGVEMSRAPPQQDNTQFSKFTNNYLFQGNPPPPLLHCVLPWIICAFSVLFCYCE